MKRGSFVGLSALAAALPALPALPVAAQNGGATRAGRNALVLIGGANRGAYEAGAIAAMAAARGLSDGQPLPFDMICGTSIGALNGYMVATAQYSTLSYLWRHEIAARDVFRLKSQFDAVQDPESGLINRAAAAFRATGLLKNVTGLLDPQPFWDVLKAYALPATPTHLPFYISTTNITTQNNQMWVRKATTPGGAAKQGVDDALLAASKEHVRPVDDSLLQRVLFASAAIPILFDPIAIPREDDPQTTDQYVDGGVTQNVPINLALLCADTLNVILLAPAHDELNEKYTSALEIGLGMFATMQAAILTYQVRLAYELGQSQLPFTPYVIRPAHDLPGHGSDFNDQAQLEEMWQLGYADMAKGWVAINPPKDLPFGSIL